MHIPRTRLRLDQPQRHPVRVADGLHFRVLAVRPGEVERQAVDINVLRVLGVGVDPGTAIQAEAGLRASAMW